MSSMGAGKRTVEVRAEGRRLYVSGLMVPWNDRIIVRGEPEWWRRGALDEQMASPQRRAGVEVDAMHASQSSREDIASIGSLGRLVDAENRRGGQWGDFRLDGTPQARMAWLLADDGVLDAFSVEFFSIDPPHQPAPEGRGATKAFGEVRHAVLDRVTLTDRPLYRRARVTAQARQRHPELDGRDERQASRLVSRQQIGLARERAATHRRIRT